MSAWVQVDDVFEREEERRPLPLYVRRVRIRDHVKGERLTDSEKRERENAGKVRT